MTDQTRQLLDRLDQAPVGQPPLPELLRAGRRAKRRRRGTAILAGGLAAVIVVATGLWALRGTGLDRASDRGDAVTAPAGTTLVGIGRAVIAVPDDWTLSTAACPGSATDVYYYPQPTDSICASPVDGAVKISTVAISASKPGDTGPMRRADPVGGYGVVDSGPMCLDSLPPHCGETFGIPSLDAYFIVGSSVLDAERIISGIRSSLTILPEGSAAVPGLVGATEQQASEELARLGLKAQVIALPCPSSVDCTHVASADPAGGAIVAAGSTVVLNLAPQPASAPPTDRSPRLDGTWKVHALIGQDAQSLLSTAQRDTLTLTFHHGTLVGSTACNDIFGTYQHNGRDLRLHPAETQVACNEPPLVPSLLEVRHVSTAGGHVYLHAENWMIIVDLERG